MRKILFGMALLSFAAPVLAAEDRGTGGGGIDRQSFAWTTKSVSTASPDWERVEQLTAYSGCFRQSRVTSADASLEVEGTGPVKVRVRAIGNTDDPDGGRIMRPGAVTFTPGGKEAFSFTFVLRRTPESHGTSYRVEWRSPTGADLTLTRGTLRVLWDERPTDFGCV